MQLSVQLSRAPKNKQIRSDKFDGILYVAI